MLALVRAPKILRKLLLEQASELHSKIFNLIANPVFFNSYHLTWLLLFIYLGWLISWAVPTVMLILLGAFLFLTN